MRTGTILLLIAGAIMIGVAVFKGGDGAGAWEHPQLTHITAAVPDGYEVVRFEVDGMCCESCPNKLRTWLGEVDGVKQAAVSFVDSQAEAVVPVGADRAALLGALNQDKYTATVAP